MKIFLVCKSELGENWSNSISSQFNHIKKNYSDQYDIQYIKFNNNILHNIKLTQQIYQYPYDNIVFINHTICLWPFYIIHYLNKKSTIYSLLHEGEIAFKRKVDLTSFKNFISLLLRSSIMYHRIPQSIVKKTYVLTNFQKEILKLKRCEVGNFLGVDEMKTSLIQSPSISIGSPMASIKIFFPFNPKRKEKGFELLDTLLNKFEIVYPNNTPNTLMANLYRDCDIVIIPSIELETYSLAFIEALAMNKPIVASINLGIIKNLLNEMRKETLASMGVYIFSPGEDNIHEAISSLLHLKEIRTREIYNNYALSSKSAAIRLFEDIISDYETKNQ